MEEKIKIVYRYVLEYYEKPTIRLVKYDILRHTPKGYWIKYRGREKWISSKAKNKFAHINEYYALKGYIRRKTYRNHCIKSEMERNWETIVDAKRLLKEHDKQRKK